MAVDAARAQAKVSLLLGAGSVIDGDDAYDLTDEITAQLNRLIPAAQIVPSLSFSNPFQQYAGGVIPGWEYGGEATLASDYITLTPATPNKVGWVWAAEPAALEGVHRLCLALAAKMERRIGTSRTSLTARFESWAAALVENGYVTIEGFKTLSEDDLAEYGGFKPGDLRKVREYRSQKRRGGCCGTRPRSSGRMIREASL